MSITPSAAALNELYLGTECLDENIERDIEEFDSCRREVDERAGDRRPSIYVDAFEQMVNTVYQHEPHLISKEELIVLEAFSCLCYNARYCLVRLLLRKSDTWHTLASMEKYTREVGKEGLSCAIRDLCRPLNASVNTESIPAATELPVKQESETIDLTFDSEDEDEKKPVLTNAEAGPSRLMTDSLSPNMDIKPTLDSNLELSKWESKMDFSFFCKDETHMTLHEALFKLSNEQLRELIRVTKTKSHAANKLGMVVALVDHASKQSVLEFAPKGKSRMKFDNSRLHQSRLPFVSHKGANKVPRRTQEERLLKMALDMLGQSVRVNLDLYWLIVRLNVIYERSTEYPKSLLVPSLLTSFKKRTYPEYTYSRDPDIWSTREELLDYVEALRLEAAIEQELEPLKPGRAGTKTPVPGNRNRFITPVQPRSNYRVTPMSGSSVFWHTESPRTNAEPGLENVTGDMEENEEVVEVSVKVQQARRVKQVFHAIIFPRWKDFVAIKREQGDRQRTPGLERFEPGFVYTRMFSKALRALATLRAFKEEEAALEALLAQRLWRRGKRAKWYDRLALLRNRYLCVVEGPDGRNMKDKEVLRQAMQGVREALEDEDTSLILRPSLVRRLRDFEKKLGVPEEERCQYLGELRKANVVFFSAERIYITQASLKLDGNGRPIKYGTTDGNGVRGFFRPVSKPASSGEVTPGKESKLQIKMPSDEWKWKGKSIWRGINGEEVNVETRALQHYESLGFKGFHSESRILTTIFALLFWDIIFADVRGAFETPHQTAPLDLSEDSFYRARKELIDLRLEEIQQKGRAQDILRSHDEKYRPKNTWGVGVRWDICESQDLLEIVECLGGESLSIICRLFCEDYAGRSSGVPDLIVWDAARHICKFVEVKGPGDRPQENQKLWFDCLLGAGADVEICSVLDDSKPLATKPKKLKGTLASRRTNGKAKVRVGDSDVEMEPESEDEAEQQVNEPWASPDMKTRASSVRRKRCRPSNEVENEPAPLPPMIPVVSPRAAMSDHNSPLEDPHPPMKKQKLITIPV